MPAPPATRPEQNRRNHVGGGKTSAIGAALVSRYVAIAMDDPACQHLSANRVSRLVRQFIAEGRAERDLVRYVVGYSDPTGEAAVRNVMRARS